MNDRLDDITARRLPAVPAPRRPEGTGRWVLTAAAVLAAVAATAALLQWGGNDALRTSPAEGSGAIHPVLGDLSELVGTGAPAPLVQGTLDEATVTSRLVIGRRDGANVVDIVQVTVSDAPDPAEAAPVGVVRRIGDRLVDFLPGPTGRVGMIIWMDPEASPTEIAEVETLLDEAAVVAGLTFVNQEAAYEEVRLRYADRPEIVELVDADDLPPSFQVQLVSDDEGLATVLREELRNLPGVSAIDSGEFEPYGDRYRWDEAEARVTVIGGTGAEAVVAAVGCCPVSKRQRPPGWSGSA